MKVKSQRSKVKSGFKFLPDIATADIAFEAYGKTYPELFKNAGLALESVMVSLDSVTPLKTRSLKVEDEGLEGLLFSFLEELVYLKDAEQMLFNRIKCEVKKADGGKWMLESKIFGELIDTEKHKLGVDVKAVTKHLFKIKRLSNKTYSCQVVLDI